MLRKLAAQLEAVAFSAHDLGGRGVGDEKVAMGILACEHRLDLVAHDRERELVAWHRHRSAGIAHDRDDDEIAPRLCHGAGSRTVITTRRFRARSAELALPETKPVAPRP